MAHAPADKQQNERPNYLVIPLSIDDAGLKLPDTIIMNPSNTEVVESYLHGLRTKDLSQVPFAADVSFEGPLTPKMRGVEAVAAFLTTLLPAIKDIRIKRHICQGEFVATEFDFDTIFGVLPVFDCFRVANGQLHEIRPYYDPRPITNPAPQG
jgi:limonene-1,2-epoxide hydrolase